MLMPLSLSPEPQRPSDISQTPYGSGMIQMHMVPCDQRFFQNAMNGLAGKSEGNAFKDAVCRNRAAIFWLRKNLIVRLTSFVTKQVFDNHCTL